MRKYHLFLLKITQQIVSTNFLILVKYNALYNIKKYCFLLLKNNTFLNVNLKNIFIAL